jgi:hypothetical protein
MRFEYPILAFEEENLTNAQGWGSLYWPMEVMRRHSCPPNWIKMTSMATPASERFTFSSSSRLAALQTIILFNDVDLW